MDSILVNFDRLACMSMVDEDEQVLSNKHREDGPSCRHGVKPPLTLTNTGNDIKMFSSLTWSLN